MVHLRFYRVSWHTLYALEAALGETVTIADLLDRHTAGSLTDIYGIGPARAAELHRAFISGELIPDDARAARHQRPPS